MLNHIKSIQAEPEYHLQLIYEDGKVISADFQPIINRGGVFSPLADPEFFRSAALDAQGRAVVWPGELEFCADALRLQGEQETYQSTPAARISQEEQTAKMFAEIIIVEDI